MVDSISNNGWFRRVHERIDSRAVIGSRRNETGTRSHRRVPQETMRAYGALPFGLLYLLSTLLINSEATSSSRRDYELYDYFVLEHDRASGMPLHDVLGTLGLELVEQAGQLKDHWLLRKRKSADDDATLSYEWLLRGRSFNELRTSGTITQRLSRAVKHLSIQTPRQRAKRGWSEWREPQSVDWLNLSSSDVAEREGIVDPEFKDQWHAVLSSFNDSDSEFVAQAYCKRRVPFAHGKRGSGMGYGNCGPRHHLGHG